MHTYVLLSYFINSCERSFVALEIKLLFSKENIQFILFLKSNKGECFLKNNILNFIMKIFQNIGKIKNKRFNIFDIPQKCF